MGISKWDFRAMEKIGKSKQNLLSQQSKHEMLPKGFLSVFF
jgi:hypothetical protein